MQVYWFKFIVELLVRILRKQGLKDTRDFEEDEGQEQPAGGLGTRPLPTSGRSGNRTGHQRELYSSVALKELGRQPLHAKALITVL